jgi:hypothetical protein
LVSVPFAVFVVVVCDEELDDEAMGICKLGSIAPSALNGEWCFGAGVGAAVGTGVGTMSFSTVDGHVPGTIL